MARLPRLYFPGCVQHVIQRGNNREACFYEEADYEDYLSFLSSEKGTDLFTQLCEAKINFSPFCMFPFCKYFVPFLNAILESIGSESLIRHDRRVIEVLVGLISKA